MMNISLKNYEINGNSTKALYNQIVAAGKRYYVRKGSDAKGREFKLITDTTNQNSASNQIEWLDKMYFDGHHMFNAYVEDPYSSCEFELDTPEFDKPGNGMGMQATSNQIGLASRIVVFGNYCRIIDSSDSGAAADMYLGAAFSDAYDNILDLPTSNKSGNNPGAEWNYAELQYRRGSLKSGIDLVPYISTISSSNGSFRSSVTTENKSFSGVRNKYRVSSPCTTFTGNLSSTDTYNGRDFKVNSKSYQLYSFGAITTESNIILDDRRGQTNWFPLKTTVYGDIVLRWDNTSSIPDSATDYDTNHKSEKEKIEVARFRPCRYKGELGYINLKNNTFYALQDITSFLNIKWDSADSVGSAYSSNLRWHDNGVCLTSRLTKRAWQDFDGTKLIQGDMGVRWDGWDMDLTYDYAVRGSATRHLVMGTTYEYNSSAKVLVENSLSHNPANSSLNLANFRETGYTDYQSSNISTIIKAAKCRYISTARGKNSRCYDYLKCKSYGISEWSNSSAGGSANYVYPKNTKLCLGDVCRIGNSYSIDTKDPYQGRIYGDIVFYWDEEGKHSPYEVFRLEPCAYLNDDGTQTEGYYCSLTNKFYGFKASDRVGGKLPTWSENSISLGERYSRIPQIDFDGHHMICADLGVRWSGLEINYSIPKLDNINKWCILGTYGPAQFSSPINSVVNLAGKIQYRAWNKGTSYAETSKYTEGKRVNVKYLIDDSKTLVTDFSNNSSEDISLTSSAVSEDIRRVDFTYFSLGTISSVGTYYGSAYEQVRESAWQNYKGSIYDDIIITSDCWKDDSTVTTYEAVIAQKRTEEHEIGRMIPMLHSKKNGTSEVGYYCTLTKKFYPLQDAELRQYISGGQVVEGKHLMPRFNDNGFSVSDDLFYGNVPSIEPLPYLEFYADTMVCAQLPEQYYGVDLTYETTAWPIHMDSTTPGSMFLIRSAAEFYEGYLSYDSGNPPVFTTGINSVSRQTQYRYGYGINRAYSNLKSELGKYITKQRRYSISTTKFSDNSVIKGNSVLKSNLNGNGFIYEMTQGITEIKDISKVSNGNKIVIGSKLPLINSNVGDKLLSNHRMNDYTGRIYSGIKFYRYNGSLYINSNIPSTDTNNESDYECIAEFNAVRYNGVPGLLEVRTNTFYPQVQNGSAWLDNGFKIGETEPELPEGVHELDEMYFDGWHWISGTFPSFDGIDINIDKVESLSETQLEFPYLKRAMFGYFENWSPTGISGLRCSVSTCLLNRNLDRTLQLNRFESRPSCTQTSKSIASVWNSAKSAIVFNEPTNIKSHNDTNRSFKITGLNSGDSTIDGSLITDSATEYKPINRFSIGTISNIGLDQWNNIKNEWSRWSGKVLGRVKLTIFNDTTKSYDLAAELVPCEYQNQRGYYCIQTKKFYALQGYDGAEQTTAHQHANDTFWDNGIPVLKNSANYLSYDRMLFNGRERVCAKPFVEYEGVDLTFQQNTYPRTKISNYDYMMVSGYSPKDTTATGIAEGAVNKKWIAPVVLANNETYLNLRSANGIYTGPNNQSSRINLDIMANAHNIIQCSHNKTNMLKFAYTSENANSGDYSIATTDIIRNNRAGAHNCFSIGGVTYSHTPNNSVNSSLQDAWYPFTGSVIGDVTLLHYTDQDLNHTLVNSSKVISYPSSVYSPTIYNGIEGYIEQETGVFAPKIYAKDGISPDIYPKIYPSTGKLVPLQSLTFDGTKVIWINQICPATTDVVLDGTTISGTLYNKPTAEGRYVLIGNKQSEKYIGSTTASDKFKGTLKSLIVSGCIYIPMKFVRWDGEEYQGLYNYEYNLFYAMTTITATGTMNDQIIYIPCADNNKEYIADPQVGDLFIGNKSDYPNNDHSIIDSNVNWDNTKIAKILTASEVNTYNTTGKFELSNGQSPTTSRKFSHTFDRTFG